MSSSTDPEMEIKSHSPEDGQKRNNEIQMNVKLLSVLLIQDLYNSIKLYYLLRLHFISKRRYKVCYLYLLIAVLKRAITEI